MFWQISLAAILVIVLVAIVMYLALPRLVLRDINKVRYAFREPALEKIFKGKRSKSKTCPLAISIGNAVVSSYGVSVFDKRHYAFAITQRRLQQLRFEAVEFDSVRNETRFNTPKAWRIFIKLFDRGLYRSYRL